MTSSRVKPLVVAAVALTLVAINVVEFKKTTTLTCPGSTEIYIIESKSRGFPLSYWRQSGMDSYPPCEFSGLSASTTFLTQAIFFNLLIGGAVLVGTHIALDYRRGKK